MKRRVKGLGLGFWKKGEIRVLGWVFLQCKRRQAMEFGF